MPTPGNNSYGLRRRSWRKSFAMLEMEIIRKIRFFVECFLSRRGWNTLFPEGAKRISSSSSYIWK